MRSDFKDCHPIFLHCLRTMVVVQDVVPEAVTLAVAIRGVFLMKIVIQED